MPNLNLTPQRGLLFRITHIRNLPWILLNGLYAANSSVLDPNFVAIGNPDLISKRSRRFVPIHPKGTLSDYVPFYFTPKSPMLLNINTGYSGITRRSNEEIAIIVTNCQALMSQGTALIFTDRHAYTATAKWSADINDLPTLIDWDILCRHDFSRSDSYPDKMERYQAEALAHLHVPNSGLLAIGCFSTKAEGEILKMVKAASSPIKVFVRPGWYF